MMMSDPPTGGGFSAAVIGGLKGTFDIAAMTDKFNLNFTIVHFLALVVCWLYSVYVDNWAGGCVITAVFLMSTNVCPDIQAFLNVLNAVILAILFVCSCQFFLAVGRANDLATAKLDDAF